MARFIASVILFGSSFMFRKLALLVYRKTDINKHISKSSIELIGIVFGFLLPAAILLVLYKLKVMHPLSYYFEDVTPEIKFR